MKKILMMLFVLVMAISLVGCGGESKKGSADKSGGKATTNAQGFFKGKNLTVIVPWSAGGGTDTDARNLAPYLEKELGCKIQVTNVPGGSGWVGWQKMLTGKADGMTVSVINLPPVLVGYLNPKMNRKYTMKDFIFLGNHVTDSTTIVCNKNETRWKDMKGLVEYAKAHEVTYGSTGSGSDEGVLMYRLNKALGTKFKEVPAKGASDTNAAIQGGHLDVAGLNVSECAKMYANKELDVLAVFADKEDPFLKGVPAFDSLKLTSTKIINASNRGYAFKAGTPEAAVKEFSAALKKSVNNPELIKKLETYGSRTEYMSPEDETKMIQENETLLKTMADTLGWNRK